MADAGRICYADQHYPIGDMQEVSFLLPALLGLLLDCATRPDQTLASISVGALVRLMEVGGYQFNERDWTTLLDSIRSVGHLLSLMMSFCAF